MDYKNDMVARYLAMRVTQNRSDPTTGVSYEAAIISTKTTKMAIDFWLESEGNHAN